MLTKCKSVIISMSPILNLVDLNLIPGIHYYRIMGENEIPDIMHYLMNNDEFAKNMAETSFNIIKENINGDKLREYTKKVIKTLESYEYVY